MRIGISCLSIDLDRIGGLQIRLKALIRRLLKHGHSIIIAQTPYSFDRSSFFYFEMKNYNIKPLIVGDIGRESNHLKDLLNISFYDTLYLLDEQVDVIDTYDPYLNIPKNRQAALVYSSNNYIEYISNHFKYINSTFLLPFLIKSLISQKIIYNADILITENAIHRDMLIKYNRLPEIKIKVILPGYDHVLVKKILEKENIFKNQQIILYNGRLTYFKGIYELIYAFKRLSLLYPNWKLYMVGNGPDKDKLNSVIKNLALYNKVKLFGDIPYEKNLELINMSDIVVLPSYIEGVPLSLIEAMALGKSVVASNVGAISHHLIKSFENGILIQPKSIDSLYDALRYLIKNNSARQSISMNAQKLVSELTFDKMAKDTLDAYKLALGG